MTVAGLVAEARRAGVEVSAHDGRLIVSSFTGPPPAELRSALRARREEVLALLLTSDASPSQHAVLEAVRSASARISNVYPPGLRARLQEHDPASWGRLEELEARVDALAQAGDVETTLTAVAAWEASWRETIAAAPLAWKSEGDA